jgi:thiol-disulfide isomerase/thioredoxin
MKTRLGYIARNVGKLLKKLLKNIEKGKMTNEPEIVRITPAALKKIFNGVINEQQYTCIVKFYSQHCTFCDKLAPLYREAVLRNSSDERYYFVFNVNDMGPALDDLVKLNGVPSFAMIKSSKRKGKPIVRIMEDPREPDESTWYTLRDLEKFINEK